MNKKHMCVKKYLTKYSKYDIDMSSTINIIIGEIDMTIEWPEEKDSHDNECHIHTNNEL